MEVSGEGHASPDMEPCTSQTGGRLGGPQSGVRRFGEEKSLLSLSENDIRANGE